MVIVGAGSSCISSRVTLPSICCNAICRGKRLKHWNRTSSTKTAHSLASISIARRPLIVSLIHFSRGSMSVCQRFHLRHVLMQQRKVEQPAATLPCPRRVRLILIRLSSCPPLLLQCEWYYFTIKSRVVRCMIQSLHQIQAYPSPAWTLAEIFT